MATITNKYQAMFELLTKKSYSLIDQFTLDSPLAQIISTSYKIENNDVKFDNSGLYTGSLGIDWYCTNKFIISTDLCRIIVNKKYVQSDEMDIFKELYEFAELYISDIKDATGKGIYIAESFSLEDPDYLKAKFLIDSYKRSLIVTMNQYEKTLAALEKVKILYDGFQAEKTSIEFMIKSKKSIFTKPIHEVVEIIKKELDEVHQLEDIESCEVTTNGCEFKIYPIILYSPYNKGYSCIGGVSVILDISKAHVKITCYNKNNTGKINPTKFHPHVNNKGGFCMGSKGSRLFNDLCAKGSLIDVMKHIIQHLRVYSPSGIPFFSLEDEYKSYPTIKEAIANERTPR